MSANLFLYEITKIRVDGWLQGISYYGKQLISNEIGKRKCHKNGQKCKSRTFESAIFYRQLQSIEYE